MKLQQPTSNGELDERELMLYVWWNRRDIVHLVFLEHNEIINAHL